MRLGGPLFYDYSDPEKWIHAMKKTGYSAALCPVESDQKDDVIQAYAKAADHIRKMAKQLGITIKGELNG